MTNRIRSRLCRCMAVLVLLTMTIGLLLPRTIALAAETADKETVFAFEQTNVTLNVGQQTRIPLLTDTVYPNIIYKSNKPDIISVDNIGTITALQQGIATITAKVNNQIYTRCIVRAVIPVTGLTITKHSITLSPGKTFRLRASIQPTNSNDKRIFWRTRSDSIAKVENGLVTAVANGMTIVSAETSNGCIDYCVVIVKTPAAAVTLNTDKLTLYKGETYTLKATVLPETASNKTVTWSSSHPEIVTVSKTGVLKAVSAGTATIRVKTANGLSASAVVNVPQEEAITAISLPSKITLGLSESHTLSPVITPTPVGRPSLTWRSSDIHVATVVSGTIYTNGVGTAVITAKTANGKSASCTVTVKNQPDSVALSPSAITIGIGENVRLTTTLPQNTASYAVTYTSSDDSVCSVSQSGSIGGKKIGSAKITVRLFNGKTAVTTVWVKASPTSMTLDNYQLTLIPGAVRRLNTYIDSNQASYKRGFISSNTAVATVDNNGNITAKAIGTATITAYTFNGITAACRVTVQTAQQPATVTFKQSAVTLYEGRNLQLETVLSEGTAPAYLIYTCADTDICTVSSTGLVKALKEGQTIVTVTTPDNKKSTCTVTVKKAPPMLCAYVTKKIIAPGQTFKIECYYDNGAPVGSYGTLTYSSTNTKMCAVTPDGRVLGISTGSVLIYAADSTGQKASCYVTVTTNTDLLNSDLSCQPPLYQTFQPVSQYPELPTGCEVTALTSVLNFFGFNVDKGTLSDDYLDKGPVFRTDFNEAFVGDPRSEYSYGCYAPVIEKAANKYLSERFSAFRAFKCIGLDFDSLFNFTDNGIPVIVWTTLNLVPGYYTDTWTADNGNTVTWYRNEHCMVLLGDDDDKVYTADPTTGRIVTYDKSLFETRYNELFRQAVVIH